MREFFHLLCAGCSHAAFEEEEEEEAAAISENFLLCVSFFTFCAQAALIFSNTERERWNANSPPVVYHLLKTKSSLPATIPDNSVSPDPHTQALLLSSPSSLSTLQLYKSAGACCVCISWLSPGVKNQHFLIAFFRSNPSLLSETILACFACASFGNQAFKNTLMSIKAMPSWISYSLIAILSSYIAIDFFLYHNNSSMFACLCNEPPLASTALKVLEEKAQKCTRREEYNDEDLHYDSRQDPWQQMKWIGEPAACPVKGQLIEKLDDRNNFRRGFALKFVDNVEDKTHILPWLLASRVDLNRSKRRVYLDLGANRFASSVQWFLRMYPCDFTEIHAFEAVSRQWRAPKKGFDEQSNVMETKNSVRVKQKPGIPQWMLDRITIHYRYVADEDDDEKNMVNITRFIKQELMLKASDTVVVKMDIEGSEWPILRRWLEDRDMPQIVDELFVEVHYADPSMSGYGWDNFLPLKREEAKRLLADLRWRGFYVHPWP